MGNAHLTFNSVALLVALVTEVWKEPTQKAFSVMENHRLHSCHSSLQEHYGGSLL